jgi:hypothetical protein
MFVNHRLRGTTIHNHLRQTAPFEIPGGEMKIAKLIVLALMIGLPTVPLISEPPQKDVPAEVESAKRALQGARNDLEHAGGNWGGHRATAMNHIDEALKELGAAEKWAQEHHDIK